MLESGGNVSSKETITDIIKIKSQCKMQEGDVETFCNWCPISGLGVCHVMGYATIVLKWILNLYQLDI